MRIYPVGIPEDSPQTPQMDYNSFQQAPIPLFVLDNYVLYARFSFEEGIIRKALVHACDMLWSCFRCLQLVVCLV